MIIYSEGGVTEREFFNSQGMIDEMIAYAASNGLTADESTYALLSLLMSTMRASGAFEHGLNDDDGVCLLHVKLYP